MEQEKLDMLLLDYWLGEPVSEEDQAAIQLWIAQSLEHRKYYEELKQAYNRCLCTW